MKRRWGKNKAPALAAIAAMALAGMALALGVASRIAARSEAADWGAPETAKNAANPVAPTEANLAAAKSLYASTCVQCHGDLGKGDGGDAAQYKPAPSDLTQPRMNEMKDGEIFWKITKGRIPMPGYEKRLNDTQRWQLVNYLRVLSKPKPLARVTSLATRPGPLPSSPAGPDTRSF
jgi:mono/diheme cytochrome c family protein